MADNFLERHRDEYEQRKQQWLNKKKRLPKHLKRNIERPEDEAL